MRVASIDIGSNTAILLIVEREPDDSGWRRVHEDAQITRVSEAMELTGLLSREPLVRTAAVLDAFRESCERFDATRVHATGTAPFRRARNGKDAADELGLVLGHELRIISGDEEARLSLLATRASFPEMDDFSMIDIGGASTEIVHVSSAGSEPEIASLDIGSVRLTERFSSGGVWDEISIGRMKSAISEALLDTSLVEGSQADEMRHCVGVAGTVTTLAAVSLGLTQWDADRVHGMNLSSAEIERLARILLSMRPSERAALPGMDPKRADVIAAGACLLGELVRFTGWNEVRVSDRGVRWGRLFAEEGT